METIGVKVRRQRRRLGLTLDELSGRTGISKPYLSVIETGRNPNPPSDDKLIRLEQSLAFGSGELVTQAHIERTPHDVRAMLGELIKDSKPDATDATEPTHLSAAVRELIDRGELPLEKLTGNAIPVINRPTTGYPKNFPDLDYPQRVAREFVACPGVTDPQAFAARVHGDSMTPKYHEPDIVVFSPAQPARSGDDCFVRFTDGKTTFQRVFFETDAAKTAVLRLQPRNEKYRPTIVKAEQVAGMYRAVFRYHRVDED